MRVNDIVVQFHKEIRKSNIWGVWLDWDAPALQAVYTKVSMRVRISSPPQKSVISSMRKQSEIICPHCKCKALKDVSEIKRAEKLKKQVFCSKKCSDLGRVKKFPYLDKSCLFCGNLFLTSNAKKAAKCCSRQCASKYSQRFVDREKISQSMKVAWQRGDFGFPKLHELTCIICDKRFSYKTQKKTCSSECQNKLRSHNATNNPNCGGETNFKRYQYKGLIFDSSWEVIIAKWLDEQQISWERSRKHIFWWTDQSGKRRRYYPDFFLPQLGVYLDPKNKYKLSQDKEKLQVVQRENHITLLVGDVEEIKVKVSNMGLKHLTI